MNHRKIFLFILIVVMAGETLALWLGMGLFINKPNSWLTVKNITMLILDGICSLLLLLTFIMKSGVVNQIILLIALTLTGISHAFRVVEFFTLFNNPFCINYPMLLVNVIKLLLILVSFTLNFNFSVQKNQY